LNVGFGSKKDSVSKPAITLGWQPSCKCYGVEIIEDQPLKPSKKKDETETEFNQRLEEYEQKLKQWYEKWEYLKPIYEKLSTAPCIVLDPFIGSGTVARVSNRLNRNWIGIDLKPEYIDMANERKKVQGEMF